MNIPLSKRLLACADFVPEGSRVADIGCDHGYLGIYLLHTGKARSVIASDIRPGPLSCAVRNGEKYGYRDSMSFYLSDGAVSIPRDFDTLVCAGMGADTMVSILEQAKWLQSLAYRLILQCQSKTPMLRRYLSCSGWYISREKVVRDGRFLYTVMEVLFGNGRELTEAQTYMSPALLADPEADTKAYYEQVLFRLRRAVAGQKDQADPKMVQVIQELEEDPIYKELQK